ncbi:Lrp/AsnC family transcriptional regulator [Lentibacter algarum]|uniref:Lrp/AsnC family transcriptional regulator n=1 Tax=Lentibacter algarum TaxID=576131 RepID=UPI001C0A0660|nr:Lrp/AsnC family transcriptional regulator [Lentibacter algarum]MBU2982521.1 Lrp/AsnC family transcriptional regulator [Lentibacter algarum]
MDNLDRKLLSALRHNARAALSDLAQELGVTRATVRNRIDRLEQAGEILGYSVVMKGDTATEPVRGLMMIGIEGRGTERIMRQLKGLNTVRSVYSTNGRWDVIAEIGTDSLEAFDEALTQIRRFDGVSTSETSLLLSAKK